MSGKSGRGKSRTGPARRPAHSEATKTDLRQWARQNWATFVEVAVLAFLYAIINAMAAHIAFRDHRPVTVDFRFGLSEILLMYLVMLVQWVGPLVVGYVYGWKRQRAVTFVIVLVGWASGLVLGHIAMSAAWRAIGFHVPQSPEAHTHHIPVWLSLIAWMVWYAILSILPTLAAMRGQKRRIAESEPSGGSRRHAGR
jgi:hypothetical protein